MIADNDERKRRCPMLGHEVAFSYCRAPGSSVPCRKIYDCWWETFDVADFVRNHYDEETIGKITAPPPPKTTTLLDLIEQAKRRCGSSE
jgi:hypothetical protein